MSNKPLVSMGAVTAPMEELMPLIEERLSVGQSVRLYPRGVSMLPLIREGKDSVTISAVQGRLKKYDVALFRCGDSYVLHRLVGLGQNGYVFCGDHRYVYERGITDEDVLAVVTAIQRNGKDVRMDGLGYRGYIVFLKLRRRARYFLFRVKRRMRRILKK